MLLGMKSIKLLATVTVLSLLAGCATTFRPWLLSDVHEGMDKVQVVQLLGTPDSTETKNGAEYLHYSFREDLTLPFPTPEALNSVRSAKLCAKTWSAVLRITATS